MEEVADYLEYSATFQIRDGQPLVQLLQQWEQERRMIPLQTAQEEQTFAALIMEAPPVLTAGMPASPMGKLGANLLLIGGFLRVWFVNKAALDRVQQEIQKRAGQGLTPPQERPSRINFGDVLAEALVFPTAQLDKEEVERRIQAQAERYFEESSDPPAAEVAQRRAADRCRRRPAPAEKARRRTAISAGLCSGKPGRELRL